MPQPLRLPFRFQLNAPISGVLKNNQPQVRYNKELIFVASRILKSKLKTIFKTIKNQQLRSPDSYLKFILSTFKLSKKQIKITYNPYTVSHIPQPPTAKTPIFCLRVKSIKQDAFLKLKEKFISIKNYQIQSVVDNKLNQLLNHFVPKVQQKVYAYGFRAILAYSKEQKGKYTIIKLLDKLSNNIKKRLFYSQFINRIKSTLSKQNKKKIAIFKLTKITKTSTNFHKQLAFRKIEVFQQSLSLQSQVAEKKTRISKIYDLNMQRTVVLQQQREALRNLKYKLDHQTIEKNHVMTEKRRSLMLARTKLNEEGKLLNEDENSVRADLYKLQKALSKEQSILEKVERIKSFVRDMKRKGVDFQSLAVGMYKSLHDLMNEDRLDLALDIVKTQELRHNVDEESGIPTLESISSTRQYSCRRILLLQKIVEGYEQKKQSSSLNSSRLRPLAPSLSTSQLKPSPSAISLKGSRLVQQGINGSMVNKARPNPPELLRLKEQFLLLQSFMSMVLRKCYDLKIKEAIEVELQHLSELLANDMKEYE